MKVLIIDHEMFLAELVKLALEADGHACFTAAGVDEASAIRNPSTPNSTKTE